MRVRLAPLLFALVLAFSFALAKRAAASVTAGEGPLTEDERARLAAGENVIRSRTLEIDKARYVGGVAYVVVASITPVALVALLSDPEAMREILPRTQYIAKGFARAGDTLLELHQGNAIVHASYTLRVRNEPEQNRVRFWLDRSKPHAIDDAWGFFRYEPFDGPSGPSMLVTYGVLVDLGPGVVRSLYEERLRAMALTVPLRLREYVLHRRKPTPPAGRSSGQHFSP